MRSSDTAEFPFANPCALAVSRPIGALKLILNPQQAVPHVSDAEFESRDVPFTVHHCYHPHFDLVFLLECPSPLCCISNGRVGLCL